jgi:prepilin-type processing-associated H-X9-DG protein
MNKAWDPDHSATTPLVDRRRPKISNVKRASEKVCLAEEKNPNDGRFEWSNIATGGNDELNDRHAKQGNILFHDWHVERKFWKELKDQVDASTSSPKGVGTQLDPFDGLYTKNLE